MKPMVLDQIKCPPKGTKKYSIPLFVNKWLPAMETYAIDYIGVGDMIGSTSNKKADKVAIGTNKFVSIGGKCGVRSDNGCRGEDRHMYLKSYPLGYMPKCENQSGDLVTTGTTDIIGGTALIGSIQEDLYNMNVGDAMAGMFRSGPFASDDCMKARLPIGNGMLRGNSSKTTKENYEDTGKGWYIEEKCVPRQPTIDKNYGGETFKIPYSKSRCTRPIKEGFQNTKTKKPRYNIFLFILIFILLMISRMYTAMFVFAVSILLLISVFYSKNIHESFTTADSTSDVPMVDLQSLKKDSYEQKKECIKECEPYTKESCYAIPNPIDSVNFPKNLEAYLRHTVDDVDNPIPAFFEGLLYKKKVGTTPVYLDQIR